MKIATSEFQNRPQAWRFAKFLLFAWMLGAPPTLLQAATDDAIAATNRLDGTSQQRRGRFGGPERGVYKSQINPHWFQHNNRFWYRNDLRDSAKEFIVVDAEHGTRQPAFDHEKLATALSKVAGDHFTADHLPFTDIEFIDEAKAVRFEAGNKAWKCDLASYECSEVPLSQEKKTSSLERLLPEATELANLSPETEED